MPHRSSRAPECNSDSPTGPDSSVEQLTSKKRTPTYLVRKEEEKALKEEVLQLEAQMAVLKTRGMPEGSAIAADPGIQVSQAKSKILADNIKQHTLGVAAAQSLMAECMRTQYSNPLCTHIVLKKDWAERRETLLSIRDQKLKNAYDYVTIRSSQTPEGQLQESSELFEADNGDICSLGSTVVHFPGVQSLRQVFEALWFYLTNMEISISERLGHITVREDYDMVEGLGYNARILSSDHNGVTTESNCIVFAQLFEQGDPRFGGEPCAIVASDSVDEDELYPYKSAEHVRKDVSGGVVMTARRQKKEDGSDGEELVVTMRRTGYLKLHHPEFPVAPVAQQELEAGIGDWGKVMIKSIREILYART